MNKCFIIHSCFHFDKGLLVLTIQGSYIVSLFSISVAWYIDCLMAIQIKYLLHAQVLGLMTFLLRYKVFPLPQKIPPWAGNDWSNFYHHSLIFISMPMLSFVSGLFSQHNCLRFILALIRTSSLFLFIGEWVVFHICLYHYVFTHSPVDGHLVCFQVRAIMNKAAVNICKQVFYVDIHFHFSG